MTRLFRPSAFLLIALALTACGGGGGGGGGGGSTGGGNVSPAEGAVLGAGPFPAFSVTNRHVRHLPGTYRFTLSVYDDAVLTDIAASEDVGEVNGKATWHPPVTPTPNRIYSWRYSVTYSDGSSNAPAPSRFYMLNDAELTPAAPRQNGVYDENLSKVVLAVRNVFTVANGPQVSYDFEIYHEPPATEEKTALYAPYSSGTVAQSADDGITTWSVHADGSTSYQWRVRGKIGGHATPWSGWRTFTVGNLCGISGSRYVEYVSNWRRQRECDDLINTDPSAVLGPPDADGFRDQDHPGTGFLTIDYSGVLDVEMGKVVYDLPGNDIRVYEYVSTEPVRLEAGLSAAGPWYLVGDVRCPEYCDFDLANAGLRYARFFRVVSTVPVTNRCYQTSGPDIDALVALHYTTSLAQCQ